MAYKLKNLKITSTDLVDRGANPSAHIGLMKRKAKDFVAGLFPGETGGAGVLSMRERAPVAVAGDCNIWKKEKDLPLEDWAILEVAGQIAEKYGLEMPEIPSKAKEKEEDEEILSKSWSKAVKGEETAVVKAFQEKISQLERSVALQELVTVAKRYSLLGLEESALAEKLYELREAGFYQDYLSVLDHSLEVVEKSGMFTEIGRTRSHFGAVTLPEKVREVMERDACNENVAFMKVYAEDVDFARDYDAQYAEEQSGQ